MRIEFLALIEYNRILAISNISEYSNFLKIYQVVITDDIIYDSMRIFVHVKNAEIIEDLMSSNLFNLDIRAGD